MSDSESQASITYYHHQADSSLLYNNFKVFINVSVNQCGLVVRLI